MINVTNVDEKKPKLVGRQARINGAYRIPSASSEAVYLYTSMKGGVPEFFNLGGGGFYIGDLSEAEIIPLDLEVKAFPCD